MSTEKHRPLEGAPGSPTAQPVTAPRGEAVNEPGATDEQWDRVYQAVDKLKATLESLRLLDGQPAVLHDFLVLQEAIVSVHGDSLFAQYWRAQIERLLKRTPQRPGQPEDPAGIGQ